MGIRINVTLSQGSISFLFFSGFGLGVVITAIALLGNEIPLKCFEAGNGADWVAAIAGSVAAIATILIGRAAQEFTRDAESARRQEFIEAGLRDEALVASQRADIAERLRRENEATIAQILVMKAMAGKARYPQQVMNHVFPDKGGVNPSFAKAHSTLILQLELTVVNVDSITWSDDSKKALDAASIEALSTLEKEALWYRTVTTNQLKLIKAKVADAKKSAGKAQTPDWENERGLSVVRKTALSLSQYADEFIGCLERRAELFK
jgi:hypothetical protein